MPDVSLNITLKQLKGEYLSSIEFGKRYLRLCFNGQYLTTYTYPVISTQDGRLSWGDLEYRDRLCEQITLIVTDAWVNATEIALGFENDVVISVSRMEENPHGSNAFKFVDRNDDVWVG